VPAKDDWAEALWSGRPWKRVRLNVDRFDEELAGLGADLGTEYDAEDETLLVPFTPFLSYLVRLDEMLADPKLLSAEERQAFLLARRCLKLTLANVRPRTS
jgi:hypothetical protein